MAEIKTEAELLLQNDETFRDEGSDAAKLKGKMRAAESRGFFGNIIASVFAALSGKSDTGHGHTIGEVDNLQTTLNSHNQRITSNTDAIDLLVNPPVPTVPTITSISNRTVAVGGVVEVKGHNLQNAASVWLESSNVSAAIVNNKGDSFSFYAPDTNNAPEEEIKLLDADYNDFLTNSGFTLLVQGLEITSYYTTVNGSGRVVTVDALYAESIFAAALRQPGDEIGSYRRYSLPVAAISGGRVHFSLSSNIPLGDYELVVYSADRGTRVVGIYTVQNTEVTGNIQVLVAQNIPAQNSRVYTLNLALSKVGIIQDVSENVLVPQLTAINADPGAEASVLIKGCTGQNLVLGTTSTNKDLAGNTISMIALPASGDALLKIQDVSNAVTGTNYKIWWLTSVNSVTGGGSTDLSGYVQKPAEREVATSGAISLTLDQDAFVRCSGTTGQLTGNLAITFSGEVKGVEQVFTFKSNGSATVSLPSGATNEGAKTFNPAVVAVYKLWVRCGQDETGSLKYFYLWV